MHTQTYTHTHTHTHPALDSQVSVPNVKGWQQFYYFDWALAVQEPLLRDGPEWALQSLLGVRRRRPEPEPDDADDDDQNSRAKASKTVDVVTSGPQIDVAKEWQRCILADIYCPKVKSLFREVWCRTVIASTGLEGLRATLDMAKKRDEAEDELTGVLIRLLDHGMEQQTIVGWVDAKEHPWGVVEVFAEWVELARARREIVSLRHELAKHR